MFCPTAWSLAEFWTEIAKNGSSHKQNTNSTSHLLGTRFAGFLEQCHHLQETRIAI